MRLQVDPLSRLTLAKTEHHYEGDEIRAILWWDPMPPYVPGRFCTYGLADKPFDATRVAQDQAITMKENAGWGFSPALKLDPRRLP